MTNFALHNALLVSGIKQHVFAARAGIGESRFSRIVHGHTKATHEEKTAIARAMSMTVEELFGAGKKRAQVR